MKVISRLLLCFVFSYSPAVSAQIAFGKLTPKELQLEVYEQDSTAHALVLYERGNTYFDIIADRIQFVEEYHVKIKIFDEQALDKANVSIPFYRSRDMIEHVKDIKAVSYHGRTGTHLSKEHIYRDVINDRWTEVKFTIPNVKAGNIIEYRYTKTSPFLFNLNGWQFQDDIPKLYSEYFALIPGNYRYNKTLKGNLKLDVNKSDVKKSCFDIPRATEPADCERMSFAMNNIPAFKEEEDYMLSKKNYISKIDFELTEMYFLDGTKHRYTKTWKDVDKEFKTDKDIGRQLKKTAFFENYLQGMGLDGLSSLEKAQRIYAMTQGHFVWNGTYSIYRDVRVKEAFEEKVGNIGEINISLINLLNAAGIPTKPLILSTRENGLPRKSIPVISDFNYLVALCEIDGQEYTLDASDKYMPFGMLPFRALNYQGRVMDFKGGSYWYDITPERNNRVSFLGLGELDQEREVIKVKFRLVNQGYEAVDKRKEIDSQTEDEYLDAFEGEYSDGVQIVGYEKKFAQADAKKITENYNLEFPYDASVNTLYLNPFFIKFFTENPFNLKERNYPVDFGYPRSYKYNLNFAIPESYRLGPLPDVKRMKLSDDQGWVYFSHKMTGQFLTIGLDVVLKRQHYASNEYEALKILFNNVVEIQKNTNLVLEKI